MKAPSKHLSLPLLFSAWSLFAGNAIAESLPAAVETAELPAMTTALSTDGELAQDMLEPAESATHNTPTFSTVNVTKVAATDGVDVEREIAIADRSEREAKPILRFKPLKTLSPAETSAQSLQGQPSPAPSSQSLAHQARPSFTQAHSSDVGSTTIEAAESSLRLANSALTETALTEMALTEISEQPVQIALEPIPEDPMAQVNNVFELQDVSPSDWAYEALQNLISRYDCIEGYPNGTFRGDRALSRYEFAAALNACWQVMERTLIEVGDRFATQDELDALNRLMAEFEAELTALNTQVDELESRVDFLEENQFSTTTKLFGQTIIGVQGRSTPFFQFANSTLDDTANEVFLSHTTQLSLFTQFSPRSLLLASVAASNGTATQFPNSIGNYTGLAYVSSTSNQLQLSDLNYRHLIGRNLAVMVGPEGISPTNVFRGTNRIESAGSGPLSSFAQRNPILSIGSGSAGLGVDWQINPSTSIQGVYAANNPETVTDGLFGGDNGSTTVGLQFNYAPSRDWDLTFQYINSYSPYGTLSGAPFGLGVGDNQLILPNTSVGDFNFRAPMKTNALGLGTEFRITPGLTFGGWVGYTISDYLAGPGQVETLNWMSSLSFPDLGGEGNIAAIFFGQLPRITSSTLFDASNFRNVPNFNTNGNVTSDLQGGQPGTSYHLEAFYRIQITDNISLTPGVIVLLNPLQNANNDTVTIGALRTTFTF